jgi:hypothetical protein
MPNPPPGAETYIRLVAAIITLMAAVMGLTSAIIKGQRSEEAASRVLAYSLMFGPFALLFSGATSYLIFQSMRVSTLLVLVATALASIDYLRQAEPPQRSDTLFLILCWSATCLAVTLLHP